MTEQYLYLNAGEVKTKSEWISQLSAKTFEVLVRYGGMKAVKNEVKK